MRAWAQATLILVSVSTSACGSPSSAGPDAGADSAVVDAAMPEPLVPAPACAAPTASRIDVLPLARLRATGTQTTLTNWTREDRDELQTIRDDDSETRWRPRALGAAVAEIDLGAATGPIALGAIELTWDGTPASVEIRVRDACGGGLVARVPATGARTELGDVCGSCVEIAVLDAGGARLSSARLESGAPGLAARPLAPEPGTPVITRPRFGAIEGFFGAPWSWEERARMIDTLAYHGLGLYVYGPKNDPRHRAEWRTPYDAAFVARFAELASFGRARGVRVVMAVSPFIDYDPAAGDRETLLTKLRAFVEAGVDGIALLADDIEFLTDRPIDAELGALHASVTNDVVRTLRAERPELTALFVGTVYSDERLGMWPGAADYLAALAAIDPSVDVMWTGTDTFSPVLSASDLAPVRDALGRDPAIWDNHYANDGGDALFGRILLGALDGRDASLLSATSAFLQNPGIQGAAARLQLGAFGAWSASPGLDAPAQRMAAAMGEARYSVPESRASADAALLVRVMELLDGTNATGDPADRALLDALMRLSEALPRGEAPLAELRVALERAASGSTARSELEHGGVAVDLVDDLSLPLGKVRAASLVVLMALERVLAARAGEDVDALDARLAEADRQLDAVSRFRFLDAATHSFVAAASAVEPSGARTTRPVLGDRMPACMVGEELVLEPFEGASELLVRGLPDHVVEGATVRWRAPHPGRFDVVLVAMPTEASPNGAVRMETVVCRPPAGS